jgi:methionine-rich copper-binding protein CopC
MKGMHSMQRLLVGLASLFVVFLAAGPALAHAHLKSAAPAEGATVAVSPNALQLQFSEGFELKFSGVKITGPANAAVTTSAASYGAGTDNTLEIPLTAPMAAGEYLVDWHILSKDGHKMTGSYKFTIKP